MVNRADSNADEGAPGDGVTVYAASGTATAAVDPRLPAFVALVAQRGRELYRDHPWRNTRDPYAVLLSEVMLQQTQVPRVVPKWEAWLEQFPTIDALAAAPLEPVLVAWQGLGYNRRAIALKRAAEEVATRFGGELPSDEVALRSLPGIGPATASGVRAFAFDLPGVYLETNVRAVFLHELFADSDGVSDREVTPLVAAAVLEAARQGVSPRTWYYALLDYGAHLKRELPNPSRRSAHHARQSAFEGSRRQKRAWLLRDVVAQPGRATADIAAGLDAFEGAAGRAAQGADAAMGILEELARDGFIARDGERWFVA
ncbi:MAG: adenine glycosylase [Coriobacteriia bacterium]|nr:adenine glycosylase [Coriobacteriia bacterium]